MLKQVTRLFDPIVDPAESAQPSRIALWNQLPYYLKDLTLGGPLSENRANRIENVKPSRSKKAGRAKDKGDALPTVADAAGEEATDGAPRLQELKKDVLQHFRKWQTAVHRRIGEISVKKGPEAQPRQFGQSPFGPKRRPSPNKRGKLSGPKVPPAQVPTVEADPVLAQVYPPTPTTLSSLGVEKRCLLLHCLLLLLLSLEHYNAHTRVLLLNLASSLQLPARILAEEEIRVGGALSQVAKTLPPDLLTQKKTEDGKPARKWKAALASMANAAVGGAGGSLAEPLMAAGIGSLPGTAAGAGIPATAAVGLLGPMADNALFVGALFAVYGARANGKMMEHYLRDVCDFAFIPLRGATGPHSEMGKIAAENRRLRVVLGISGWLTNKTDSIADHWQCLGEQTEVYAVRWELEALVKLGSSFETLVRSAAWSRAKKEIMARTSEPRSSFPAQAALSANQQGPVFANLVDGRWPESLLKISKIVDNSWNNGMVRADKLGAALADVIMGKAQGERGVSLIGYSLGARAIYACLMCLAERRAFGLVENAVMMGTPAPSEPTAWCAMKSVVSGRLVNVYSENDYILGFLYRTSSIDYGLAGLQQVTGVDGIENVDVTAKISLHPRYRFLIGSILRHIGWEDTDREQIARDEAEMSFYEDRNRKHEERRNTIEWGETEIKKGSEPGVIRTRMRKKNKK
ncbi:uncharacterized protein THITE_2058773 [Thermothielavioides terrestris NRRL 8126]|uniref:DUF726-domain-containing protein n=1 Tax=Thermothielavioides terrestris (strain ATCC 38088 / NRRL 8126) TaxID=578455 RepID=G2RIG7_THETT|nr:uncharacterized protein THITE_2058773 [Thermothielavioides terrestris NRRL 8126]AEO71629.1 hypothetical protein THITE_2058773 [Thermothielavioides terrestris NRRL 8126]